MNDAASTATETLATPTRDQIEALMQEAVDHGDQGMAVTCEEALAGDADALDHVAHVIADAAAQDDVDYHGGMGPGVF